MSEENTTASEKRELIRDTIIDIRSKIPEGRVPEYLTNLLEKIPYMAPEILGNSWTKLHKILQTYIPISRDSENPPWILEVETIWNGALEKYSKLGREKSQNAEI